MNNVSKTEVARESDSIKPYLPTSGLLVFVICIVVHDEVVDTVEIQLPFWRIDNRLGNHLRIAVLRLDVFVLVKAEINVVGVQQQRA